MHPSISEQLAGLSRVLTDVVQPELTNPYPLDVLHGVAAALETLSRGWADYPAYLRWDAEATVAILRRLDLRPPLPPADVLDLAALEAHHAALDAATADHFRQRIERFPFGQLTPRRA